MDKEELNWQHWQTLLGAYINVKNLKTPQVGNLGSSRNAPKKLKDLRFKIQQQHDLESCKEGGVCVNIGLLFRWNSFVI